MQESETPGEHAASEAETKSGNEAEQAEPTPPGTGSTSPKESKPDVKYQG